MKVVLRMLAVTAGAVALMGAPSSAGADPLGWVVELTSGGAPEGITAGPDGNLWMTERTAKKIARITPGGAVTEFGPVTNHPASITTGPDGNVWFTEAEGTVGRITPSGVITEFSANITPGAGLSEITLGPDGNLWFTETIAARIGRITPTGVITEFSAGSPLSAPTGIAAGSDGNLWFTQSGTDRIGRISTTGNTAEYSAGITPGAHPARITVGGDGNLWFTEPDVDKVARITPTGTVTEFSTGIVLGSHPFGITPGPDNNLWVTSIGAVNITRLYRVSRTGDVTALAPGTAPATGLSAGFVGRAITTGSDGNLWFADAGGINLIGRVGAGMPAARLDLPVVTGSQQALTQQQCSGERWSTWGGQQPLTVGIQWQLDGVAIPGATARTYKPTEQQVGHDLRCIVTAKYELLGTTVPSTSAATTVLAAAVATAGTATGAGTGAAGLPGPAGSSGANGSNGAKGDPGSAGAKGATGAAGANGKVQLIKCTKVTKVNKKTKKAATTTKCAGRVVDGTLTFKLETAAKASAARLSRPGQRYDVVVRDAVGGGFTITRKSGKTIPAGRYTLRRGHTSVQVTL